MKYTFQHFVDIKTSAESLTMIQIQAGGEYAMQRIKHLIGAYKYVKLGRVSVKLLPASTLPVDPLGLSYDSADPQTVDPRDQMNPGLVRITNGEDLLTDFEGMSSEVQQLIYTNTMLDPRWSKFMLQSGFKRSAVPLYWNVGQLAQDPFPGAVTNVPSRAGAGEANPITADSDAIQEFSVWDADRYITHTGSNATNVLIRSGYSDPRGFFQTGHRGRMGWMPTDAFYNRSWWNDDEQVVEEDRQAMFMPLPSVNVITVLFPKAYKTKYYYRMFITETVYLSGLKNTGINGENDYEYRAIDNFVQVPMPVPFRPNVPETVRITNPSTNDGGGRK